jgi:hypothetical protein
MPFIRSKNDKISPMHAPRTEACRRASRSSLSTSFARIDNPAAVIASNPAASTQDPVMAGPISATVFQIGPGARRNKTILTITMNKQIATGPQINAHIVICCRPIFLKSERLRNTKQHNAMIVGHAKALTTSSIVSLVGQLS